MRRATELLGHRDYSFFVNVVISHGIESYRIPIRKIKYDAMAVPGREGEKILERTMQFMRFQSCVKRIFPKAHFVLFD